MVARSHLTPAAPERPPVQTTYMVKQLELAVRKELDRVVRPFGLTTPQYTALSVLVRHPRMSSAQLARLAFVSPQAAHQMVVALERKGIVSRTADPSNQRSLETSITDLGRAALARCSDAVADIEERMLGGLERNERALLRDLLNRCLHALQRA